MEVTHAEEKRNQTAGVPKINPLGRVGGPRLNRAFFEVFTRPQDHRPLSSAWDDFLGLQKFVATRIRYTDWIR
jgi:hypothetical protein